MRRDLETVKSELKGSILIYSAPLRRDFARKPAYWVELYRTPKAKSAIYRVARQWGFTRGEDQEKIQDAAVSSPILSLKAALSYLTTAIESKIKVGWLVCDESFAPERPRVAPTADEQKIIKSYMMDWASEAHGTSTTPKQNPITPAEKFKKAQRRRRAKAEW